MEDVLNYSNDDNSDLSIADSENEILMVELPELACYKAYLGALEIEVYQYFRLQRLLEQQR